MKYHVTFYDNIDRSPFPKFSDQDIRVDNMQDADVLVSVGGDGTFLKMFQNAVQDLYDEWNQKYFLGINLGHVGFLTNDRSIVGQNLEELVRKDVIFRYPLKVNIADKYSYYALNEVVVRSSTGRLLSVDVQIGDVAVNYKGDGLIVASSTGSTAYNLSAGGPILDPSIPAVVVTPICSFTLSNRSVVFNITAKLSVVVDDVDFHMFIDGQTVANQGPITFAVEVSDEWMQTIWKSSFVEAIQNKLGWNNNIRSQ